MCGPRAAPQFSACKDGQQLIRYHIICYDTSIRYKHPKGRSSAGEARVRGPTGARYEGDARDPLATAIAFAEAGARRIALIGGNFERGMAAARHVAGRGAEFKFI
jgi:hypothetical protein